MKLKHNKKRNTAFLYEVLVRHLTKSIIERDLKKKKKISNVIRKYFRAGTALREELEIYKAIAAKEKLDYHIAEKLVFEAKKSYFRIDQEQLFKEQSSLIKRINQLLSKKAYSIFVPNYKSLASVQQIFNDQVSLKTRMLLEEKVIRNLVFKQDTSQDNLFTVDNIVYRTFVKRFNKEYKDTLLEEQKTLLNKYITSFIDNGLELKIFLNEEITRLRTLIKTSLKNEEIILQEDVSNKIKEVLNVIDEFKKQEVDKKMVEQVLKIQSLVKEI